MGRTTDDAGRSSERATTNGRRVVRARRSWRSWTETETRTEESAEGRTVESADGGASGARARTGIFEAREARGVCVWFGFG